MASAAWLSQSLGQPVRTVRMAPLGLDLVSRTLRLEIEADPAMRQLAPGLETTLQRLQACGDGHQAEGRWLLLDNLSSLRAGNPLRGLSGGKPRQPSKPWR